jgi:GWxTD domain-containing protein
MKKLLLFLLLIGLFGFGHADLKMYVQANRYLDEDFNTNHEIIYEIPYANLTFIPTENGYGAQVDVEYVIKKGENEYPGNFSNNIILTDFHRTVSDESFLDKILITLAKPGYEIEVKFIDELSKNEKKWNYTFEQLGPDIVISDVEISKQVVADTTSYLEKFHRDGNLFLVNTSNIFIKDSHPKLYLYFEIYSFFSQLDQINEKITLYKKDEIILETDTNYSINNSIKPVIREFDISDYAPGLYRIELEIAANSEVSKREIVFTIKKDEVKIIRFFDDDEKDFDLVKMFLNANERATFNTLDKQSKLHFMSRYWRSRERLWGVEGSVVPIILERLSFVNEHYGSMRTEGWQTDRGRIYLKYGEPDEIVRLNTNMYDRDVMQDTPQIMYTALGAKDFHIWKYRSTHRNSYVFLDSHGNRLFRLIYAGDDDTEVTNPNWKTLIGGDSFDESLLD